MKTTGTLLRTTPQTVDSNPPTAAPERRPDAPIRIVLVDDHPVVTHGLSALLSAQPDFEVVGVANDSATGQRLVEEMKPDVVLLDAAMPGMSGADAMRWLRHSSAHPKCRAIFFTNSPDDTELLTLVKLGARGLMLKDAPLDMVLKSIRKVHAGEVWIGRRAMAAMAKALTAALEEPIETPHIVRDFGLTRRECTVLKYIARGDTNSSIAERLGVSENTVKHHLTNTFNKTGTSSRLELALFALHHRIVDPE